jgi:hypothetical protein
MKYFFLSEGWKIGRVWEFGGLWNDRTHRRSPHIEQLSVTITEGHNRLHLYRVEPDILMVEVKPQDPLNASEDIGQVVLKRLMSADQVIDRLSKIAQPDRTCLSLAAVQGN